MRRGLAGLLVNVALALGALFTATPLLWMVSASFMPAGQASELPPRLLPNHPTLEHYATLFSRLDLARHLSNSLLIAIGSTLICVALCGMAGYAFAKLEFRGRERIFRLLVLGMLIPAQVGMLPLFLLLKGMGLVNTMAGVMIPMMAPIFGIFMVRQYALGIPRDLLDAARMDGASEGRLFWTIVVPTMRPILATLATFIFLSTWNDFLWPLIVLSDDARYTLPVALANLSGEHVQDTELMMAGAVLTVTPVLLVFLVLQRQYVRGLFLGSVKG
ncbi:MAG: carbohydrate ABC transporter permease [Candidatus Eisenbacteria bacterium]|uniref:Carbohydrate ABC transporter permease n=1 Tax=Eiseniibacteriota bacterium TaxID=2212470 RepID=A0A538TWS0_UNCEI|nr:MAG: carbohydrate ABC transporter permease [Candidatus Eisenbacteria bacterium]